MSAVPSELVEAVERHLARCVWIDGCLVLPENDGNYSEVRWGNGRRIGAHRAVVAVSVGDLPDDRNIVTKHACDNPPCVNIDHLSFGSQAENSHEAYGRRRHARHTWPRGEERPGAVLTEGVVCDMRRAARAGMSLGEIATKFGVNYSPARMAVRGETWQHVTAEPPVPGRRNAVGNPSAYRLTRQDDASRVLQLVEERGLSLAEIGQLIGVSRATAWNLLQVARELVSA